MRRLSVLMSVTEADAQGQARVAALKLGLLEHGWIEGRNLEIDYRWGGGDSSRLRAYAAELTALNPDVIFAAPSAALAAVQRITRTIPVVFAQVSDPVGAGFVASLAHPGGNITGFALFEFSIGAKWLELLKAIAPSMTRAAVLRDTTTSAGTGWWGAIQTAAPPFGVEVVPVDVRDASEIERAVAVFAHSSNGALIVPGSASAVIHRDLIVALAGRYKLPAVFYERYFVAAGGLISYGPDFLDLFRRAAGYVDRILKGEKPADLPVQAPTKYELVVNLKTAKALGLTIPQSVIARADEVIE
jgi:putative ABC transport system substrate-binding protein